jgi:hypothetical protein
MGWIAVDLTQQTGAPLATFRPTAYVFPFQGTQHVVYQGFTPGSGPDGRLHELYWDTDGWHHNDLTSAAEAPMATGSPWGYLFAADGLTGTQHVVYQGANEGVADGRVHELWWDSDGWHHNDLTVAISVPAAPAAINVPVGHEFFGQRVFYQGRDGHIHLLFFDWANPGWRHRDLNKITNTALAGGPPSSYPFWSNFSEHAVYVGTDGHVHHLGWRSGAWTPEDLTLATGSPPAAEQPCGYAFEAQFTQHVVYVGTDRHLHELWRDLSSWHHSDLTALTGAPAPFAALPSGYVFDAEGTQHIDYLGIDDHIHELWWNPPRHRPGTPPSGWNHHDLTAATGGPPSISGPCGYVYKAYKTQHVFYVSDQHHIIELYWKA